MPHSGANGSFAQLCGRSETLVMTIPHENRVKTANTGYQLRKILHFKIICIRELFGRIGTDFDTKMF